MRVRKIVLIKTPSKICSENSARRGEKHLFQLFLPYFFFIRAAKIYSVYLMEYIHMVPVYLVFAIHFSVRPCAERFAVFDFTAYFRKPEIVVPHYGCVRTKNVIVVYVISVGVAARRMIRRKIKKIKTFARRNYFWNADDIKTGEIGMRTRDNSFYYFF